MSLEPTQVATGGGTGKQDIIIPTDNDEDVLHAS